jgi:hypothetical protein
MGLTTSPDWNPCPDTTDAWESRSLVVRGGVISDPNGTTFMGAAHPLIRTRVRRPERRRNVENGRIVLSIITTEMILVKTPIVFTSH